MFEDEEEDDLCGRGLLGGGQCREQPSGEVRDQLTEGFVILRRFYFKHAVKIVEVESGKGYNIQSGKLKVGVRVWSSRVADGLGGRWVLTRVRGKMRLTAGVWTEHLGERRCGWDGGRRRYVELEAI